jgi:hypothetical protein
LEINRRIVQIDHNFIRFYTGCLSTKTKHFNAAIKINGQGEFLRWNNYQKTFEGMPSLIAQNERHKTVLNDFFKQSEMPKRLGMKLIPKAECFVLVSNNARIDRQKQLKNKWLPINVKRNSICALSATVRMYLCFLVVMVTISNAQAAKVILQLS